MQLKQETAKPWICRILSNGILKLTIPKPAQSEPKKIEVKDAA